jgi:hypothetical protein
MKKIVKRIIAVLCCVMTIIGSNNIVMAQRVSETGNNSSMETADLIQAHRQTAQEYLNANNANSYVVKGTIYKNEEDWFKVYLERGKDTYFSIYSDLLYFQLRDANGNIVNGLTCIDNASVNYQVIDLGDLPSGYYFIQLKNSNATASYQFVIGNLIYRIKQVSISGHRISLSSSNRLDSDEIDFNAVDYPNEAAIYQIGISGVNSSYASKVEVSFDRSSKSISKSYAAEWGIISVPLSYEYTFGGQYTFTYAYNSSTKRFTPGYIFYCVYPLLP